MQGSEENSVGDVTAGSADLSKVIAKRELWWILSAELIRTINAGDSEDGEETSVAFSD